MQSIFDGERLSLNQVALKLKVHVATVWRWVTKGVRGRRLLTKMVGGRRYVFEADLSRFLDDADERTPSLDRDRRADLAGHILDAQGVSPRAKPKTPRA